jgi:hypothetical protein
MKATNNKSARIRLLPNKLLKDIRLQLPQAVGRYGNLDPLGKRTRGVDDCLHWLGFRLGSWLPDPLVLGRLVSESRSRTTVNEVLRDPITRDVCIDCYRLVDNLIQDRDAGDRRASGTSKLSGSFKLINKLAHLTKALERIHRGRRQTHLVQSYPRVA